MSYLRKARRFVMASPAATVLFYSVGALVYFGVALALIYLPASVMPLDDERARTLALTFGAIFGFPLLVWRGLTADKQVKASNRELVHGRFAMFAMADQHLGNKEGARLMYD